MASLASSPPTLPGKSGFDAAQQARINELTAPRRTSSGLQQERQIPLSPRSFSARSPPLSPTSTFPSRQYLDNKPLPLLSSPIEHHLPDTPHSVATEFSEDRDADSAVLDKSPEPSPLLEVKDIKIPYFEHTADRRPSATSLNISPSIRSQPYSTTKAGKAPSIKSSLTSPSSTSVNHTMTISAPIPISIKTPSVSIAPLPPRSASIRTASTLRSPVSKSPNSPFSPRSFKSIFSTAESTNTSLTISNPTTPQYSERYHYPNNDSFTSPRPAPSSGLHLYNPNIRPSKGPDNSQKSPPLPNANIFEPQDSSVRDVKPVRSPPMDKSAVSKLVSRVKNALKSGREREKEIERGEERSRQLEVGNVGKVVGMRQSQSVRKWGLGGEGKRKGRQRERPVIRKLEIERIQTGHWTEW